MDTHHSVARLLKQTNKTYQEYWTFLVYGYIRIIIQLSIPSDIKNLCIEYISGDTDFEFQYKNGNESTFKIIDNGLTINTIQQKCGTILFGNFFELKQYKNLNFTVHFQLKKINIGSIGFGFATPEFKAYVTDDFNPCKNHSLVLATNAYFKKSDDFSTDEDHESWPSHMEDWITDKDKGNGVVAVNINMNNKIGTIWNWKKNDEYKNNANVLSIGLPDIVGIIVYYGFTAQSITVIKQFFSKDI